MIIWGRLGYSSKDERDFWDNFQGLLLDDPQEVPYNDLITNLRNIAIKYWKEKNHGKRTTNGN